MNLNDDNQQPYNFPTEGTSATQRTAQGQNAHTQLSMDDADLVPGQLDRSTQFPGPIRSHPHRTDQSDHQHCDAEVRPQPTGVLHRKGNH